MTNNTTLRTTMDRDRGVWDSCAAVYEREIVRGHPDVLAYEAFEEDFLDHVLHFLALHTKTPLQLLDVGCGSARLHLRYGLKTTRAGKMAPAEGDALRRARGFRRDLDYDPVLAGESGGGLKSIGGIDFSTEMIGIAGQKLAASGLGQFLGERLWLRQGSAFDLEPMEADPLPVLVTVCNSIGVMQGPEGAQQLFQALRRAVEPAGGIAIISAYRKEAMRSHALGNYESTMNVSGQPKWLAPDSYAAKGLTLFPRKYKRAWDSDETVCVDVCDVSRLKLHDGLVLRRISEEVERTIETGYIRTWGDYESRWYSFDQIGEWIDSYWGRDCSLHLAGSSLDSLRGAPAQLAIYDPNRRLNALLARWQEAS